jgi:hypothetical protein
MKYKLIMISYIILTLTQITMSSMALSGVLKVHTFSLWLWPVCGVIDGLFTLYMIDNLKSVK